MVVKYLTRKDVRSKEVKWLKQKKLEEFMNWKLILLSMINKSVLWPEILVLVGTSTMAKNYGAVD
jgi:hypothetical protein